MKNKVIRILSIIIFLIPIIILLIFGKEKNLTIINEGLVPNEYYSYSFTVNLFRFIVIEFISAIFVFILFYMNDKLLYIFLGIFIIFVIISGFIPCYRESKEVAEEELAINKTYYNVYGISLKNYEGD